MTLGKALVPALASALALILAAPAAEARPRFGPAGLLLAPLAIVGGIAGAAIGSRKARAHRSYQDRPRARRDRGATRQAREAAPSPREPAEARSAPGVTAAQPQAAQQAAQPVTADTNGWAGPLFWPHAYDGVFEYAFGLPGDDSQFWARGFGDVIDGMFRTPASADELARRASQRSSAPDWQGRCGSEAPNAAEATIERLRQVVKPSPEQDAALGDLRAALLRATEKIETACPAAHAATPPERLQMMIARLAAMRQAVLAVQGPLRTFYHSLTPEQRNALDGGRPAETSGSSVPDASAQSEPRIQAGAGCAAPVAHWPQHEIARAIQPTRQQQAMLEELRQRSLGFAQFVASTCPREMPRSAVERLEAVKDRLAVLRYAASNVSPAFEAFYGSLSDAQKARFRSMGRERQADNRR